MKQPHAKLGRRLRAARKKINRTQQATARLAGITNVHLNRLEHGKMMPGVDTLQRLAKALGTTMDALLS